MPRIAVVDGGTYYHHRGLYGDRYRSFFDGVIYLGNLSRVALQEFDIVVFPDRLHPGLLVAAKDQIHRYLSEGGTVVALGESRVDQWLPSINWSHRPTNYWWWKTPGASLGLVTSFPEHSLFRFLSLSESTWHYHGVFVPPEGARTLISVEGDGTILYEDEVSTRGRMIISSLDPFYHYGSHFMPITERFLDGFLRWLRA